MSKLKGIFAQIRRAAASKVESRQSKLQKREALPPAAVLARGHGSRGQVQAGIGAGLSEKLDTVKGVFAGVQDKIVAKLGRVKGILGQIGGEVEDKVASLKGKLHKREAVEAVLSDVNRKSQAVHSEISEKSQKLREKFAKIKAEIDAKFEYVDAKLNTFFSRLQKEFESKFGSKV